MSNSQTIYKIQLQTIKRQATGYMLTTTNNLQVSKPQTIYKIQITNYISDKLQATGYMLGTTYNVLRRDSVRLDFFYEKPCQGLLKYLLKLVVSEWINTLLFEADR